MNDRGEAYLCCFCLSIEYKNFSIICASLVLLDCLGMITIGTTILLDMIPIYNLLQYPYFYGFTILAIGCLSITSLLIVLIQLYRFADILGLRFICWIVLILSAALKLFVSALFLVFALNYVTNHFMKDRCPGDKLWR